MQTRSSNQSGFFMIEALVAILIFTLGILAMVGTGAMSVSTQADAQYRGEAARLAAELISNIYPSVNISNDATVKAALPAFEHNAAGNLCAFTGTPSTNGVITDWLTKVHASTGLPGSGGAGMQQVLVDTSPGGLNKVQVTLCWKAPSDNSARNLVYTGYIN